MRDVVNRRNRLFAVMASSFVVLGMPMAAMGVAWPSAADDLGRSLGELGLVTLAYGAGYTASTLASGELTHRFGTGPLLKLAAVAAAASLAVLAVTSQWPVFLVSVLALGVAGGMLDSGVNAYVAVYRGTRSMGIIHTGFGIGSAVGPLLITALLAFGASWRLAFGALAIADLVLAAGFMATVGVLARSEGRAVRRPSIGSNGQIMALSVAVFFFYAGVAAGTGVWAFSFLTEARGIDPTIAGVTVAAYWALLTAARVGLGVLGDRVDAEHVLTVSGVATAATLAVAWLVPVPWIAVLALAISGFAHGSVFPLGMTLTARRFGDEYTPWAVGYEIAGANVGVALLTGGIGLLVARWGAGAIAPGLFVIALLLLVALEALRVRSAEGLVRFV